MKTLVVLYILFVPKESCIKKHEGKMELAQKMGLVLPETAPAEQISQMYFAPGKPVELKPTKEQLDCYDLTVFRQELPGEAFDAKKFSPQEKPASSEKPAAGGKR